MTQQNPGFARVAAASGITELRTAYRSPRRNASCKQFLGSVRRECPDHVLVLDERHLQRVRRAYAAYSNRDQPHQGLQQQIPDIPTSETSRPSWSGRVHAVPLPGGLHHVYERAA